MVKKKELNEEQKEWLKKDRPDEFYRNAGKIEDKDIIDERFDEIPDSFNKEVQVMFHLYEYCLRHGLKPTCRDFQILLFDEIKKLEENDIYLKIPFYWGEHPIIIPEELVKISNGLIGFNPDEDCDTRMFKMDVAGGCIRREDCWFYNNKESDGRTSEFCNGDCV